ncbi:MAG: type II CAAX endopeptidase family protein [Rhodothermales bacterium]
MTEADMPLRDLIVSGRILRPNFVVAVSTANPNTCRMTVVAATLPRPLNAHSEPISRARWAAALVVGAVLAVSADFASQAIPQVVLHLPLEGSTFALVGLLKVSLGLAALALGLRIANLRFRDVGLVADGWRRDAMIGLVVAVVYAALQFLVIIPATGGASRADIVVESERLGDSLVGVGGFVVLAWTGVFFEELLFRGLFFHTVWRLLGGSRLAMYVTVAAATLTFAAGHGYQGLPGMIDTGLFGGLLLTLLFVWRGRLTAPIVAHAMWNTLAPIGIYLLY